MTNPLPAGTGSPELDWARWEAILNQFSAATGLVVSLYDTAGDRRVGPMVNSRLSRVLSELGLWAPGAAGNRVERDLAIRSMASGQLEVGTFCTELQVRALPLSVFEEVRGAVVIGWVFCGFPTALANERLARELGATPSRLWREVRLESPVSPARMAVFYDLLQTLVDSNVHQTEAIEKLHELARTRDVLLGQVSHDLRTPLTAISLRIEALLAGDLNDPAYIRETLERIRVSVKEESRLIEDLIDTARTRTGHLKLDRGPAQLSRIVQRAIVELRPQAEQKRISIRFHCHNSSTESPVFADESRMQQVFWNLLSNAIKFSHVGSEVTVHMGRIDNQYEILVRDEGVGVRESLLGNIFDAFTKHEKGNEKGLGLGLPIAKHIIEMHGGSIRVYSAGEGQGTEFVIRLPVPAS